MRLSASLEKRNRKNKFDYRTNKRTLTDYKT